MIKRFRQVTPLHRTNEHISNAKKIEDTIDLLGNSANQEVLFQLEAKIREERFMAAVLDDKINCDLRFIEIENPGLSMLEVDEACSKSPTGNCWYDVETKNLSVRGWFHSCEYCGQILSDVKEENDYQN